MGFNTSNYILYSFGPDLDNFLLNSVWQVLTVSLS